MYYKQSIKYIKKLIAQLGVKLIIRNNIVGPQGCYYDSNKKLIHLNKVNTSRKTVAQILVHEYAHRFQDRIDSFTDDPILQKGQHLWTDILHGKKKYNPNRDKKYRDQVLKMQYDGARIAVKIIKANKFLRKYIGIKAYIKDTNFYMQEIKYQFETGKTKLFTQKDYANCPFTKCNLMTDKQLCRPITEQQILYFEGC